MQVTITVINASTQARCDVALARPRLDAQLVRRLRATVGAPHDAAVSLGGRILDSHTRQLPITNGETISFGECSWQASPHEPTGLAPVLGVVAGPDAGRWLTLDGSVTVGRAAECDLVIHDRSISRHHLQLSADRDDLQVTDLGSQHGSWCETVGRLAAGTRAGLAVGQELRLGHSRLAALPGHRPVATSPQAEGGILLHPEPHRPAAAAAVEVHFPAPPEPPGPLRLPVLAAVIPLVAGGLVTLVLRQWTFLAFVALAPAMVVGQALSDRRSRIRQFRTAGEDHAAATAAAHQRLEQALAAERHERTRDCPDLATLTVAAHRRTVPLWGRHTSELLLRLGRGDLGSMISVTGADRPQVCDVPVTCRLPGGAVTGVTGPAAPATALVRALLIQAATLHPPSRLAITVLAPGHPQPWEWVRWLPHIAPRPGQQCTAAVAFDAGQVSRRVEELTSAQRRGHTLVVVDSTSLTRSDDSLQRLGADLPEQLHVIWLDPAGRLPGGCRRLVDVESEHLAWLHTSDEGGTEVRPDLVSVDVAESTARALAPLIDSGYEGRSLPVASCWESLVGVDLRDPVGLRDELVRRWVLGPSTTVYVGTGEQGATAIDLAGDGPHVLLAGMTGSGKSELLRTIVAGLALANRPEDLSLLLVDYKGGAAFGAFTELPHTAGVLTDLDGAGTTRALASLRAELRRRETALAAAGVSDFVDVRSTGADRPHLPRLVLVVDEFATLRQEHPDFVPGLVDIARRGRSLGIHLILATQRPQGAVSPDIRANTGLRICLAVGSEEESRDVLGGPQAAGIDPRTPGRGYLRAGPAEVTAVQAARITGAAAPEQQVIVPSPAAVLGDPPVTTTAAAEGGADRARGFVDAAVAASRCLGCVPPRRPWLPPLPAALRRCELPPPSPGHVAWGLVDDPAHQQQRPLELPLDAGSTTVVGGMPRSGRSTAVRSLLLGAACALSPAQLNAWCITTGDLHDLAALPHVGAVIDVGEVERVERLLTHLRLAVGSRRRAAGPPRPLLLLAVDTWDGFVTGLGEYDGGRLVTTLLQLMADGTGAGILTIVTGDHGCLFGRVGSTAGLRIALRLSNRVDYTALGISLRDLPEDLPAGRGVCSHDGSLVQVALPDPAGDTAARRWVQPATAARFDPVPDRVRLTPLIEAGAAGAGGVVLGVRTDDGTPVQLDPGECGGMLLVTGPPRSGRSTALVTVARQLRGAPLVVYSPRRSPLRLLTEVVHLPLGDDAAACAELDRVRSAAGRWPHLLLDDLDLLGEGQLWGWLERSVAATRDGGHVVALAATTEAVSVAFRGPVAAARRTAVGVLLQPRSTRDGDLFGVRLPRPLVDAPAGRGWLVVRGEPVALQVAQAEAQPAA